MPVFLGACLAQLDAGLGDERFQIVRVRESVQDAVLPRVQRLSTKDNVTFLPQAGCCRLSEVVGLLGSVAENRVAP